MQSTSICTHCGLEFIPSKVSRGIFCSSSCSATVHNQSRPRNLYSRERTSQTLKMKYAEGVIIKSKRIPKTISTRPCSVCHNPTKAKNIVCSRKCLGIHLSRKYPPKPSKQLLANNNLPNIPIKRESTKSCISCNNIFVTSTNRKTCSKECLSDRFRQRASDYLRKNRHKYVGPHKRSWMERTFVEWLEKHNITKGIYGYWDEVHFKHIVNNKKKNGWADFVFVSRKLIIELDGTHHRTRADLDAVRDSHLSSKRGYTVVRISHAEYKKGTRIAEIKNLLGI